MLLLPPPPCRGVACHAKGKPLSRHPSWQQHAQLTPQRTHRRYHSSPRPSPPDEGSPQQWPNQSSEKQTGRFLRQTADRKPRQAAAQALHEAATLAALGGPHISIRGPRRRTRLGAPLAYPLWGRAGQPKDPWWRWKQWLAGHRQAAAAAGDAAGHNRLHALHMDDADMDLDQMDEATTQQDLHGSRQEMQEAQAKSMWRHLRKLAAQQQAVGEPHGATRSQIPPHGPGASGGRDTAPGHRGAGDEIRGRAWGDSEPGKASSGGRGGSCEVASRAGNRGGEPGPHYPGEEQLPYLGIFKGGGYVAADLAATLDSAGLAGVLRLQLELKGAHCILAMPRWKSGHHVDLRQQQAAARARGIPLLLSPSLRPVDLLLTLRPVLLAHGMVPDTSRSRKVLVARQGQPSSLDAWPTQAHTEAQADPDASAGSKGEVPWADRHEGLLAQLAKGQLTVSQYILAAQL